jgi:hypothetical protein
LGLHIFLFGKNISVICTTQNGFARLPGALAFFFLKGLPLYFNPNLLQRFQPKGNRKIKLR